MTGAGSALEFDLRYGRGTRHVLIPSGMSVRIVEPKDLREVHGASVREALMNPIGSPRLSELAAGCDVVTVVVNDITRMVGTSEFLPLILDELKLAGVSEGGVRILVATGSHRPHTPEEHRLIVGDDVYRTFKVYDHVCTDRENMRYVGTTSRGNRVFINRLAVESRLVVLTGEITYHYTAGYSGGRKSIMPGIASYESIKFNHQKMSDPRCGPGSVEGNPVHEDAVEAAGMISPLFIVNVIRDPECRLVHAVAGHYLLAHEEGCRWAARLYRVPSDESFDVVVASCGGSPKDIDLYQAHKSLENACSLAKDGGEVILFAECPDGPGGDRFETVVRECHSFETLSRLYIEEFDLGLHKAYCLSRLARRHRVTLVCSLESGFARNLGMNVVENAGRVLSEVFQRVPSGAKVAVMPEASFTFPF